MDGLRKMVKGGVYMYFFSDLRISKHSADVLIYVS